MAVYNWHDPLARSVDAAIFVNNLFQYEVLRMRSWISYHKVCLLMFYKKFRDYSFCHRNAYLWVTYVVIDVYGDCLLIAMSTLWEDDYW